MKCENCGNEHDGSYGSGRFCGRRCRSQFSAKGKRNVDSHVGLWKCDQCDLEFKTRSKLYEHKHEVHKVKKVWNKGRTKHDDSRLAKMSESYSRKIKNGEIHVWCEGKHLSDETRLKISSSMKKAHVEGRAHNIGESRWNNDPSYPEKWFMQVIENEFSDKNYVREHPFHLFSLDFAWLEKKKCIEIDGEQHYRFSEYIERDKRKDAMLLAENWKILRLPWKEVFKDPKKWITIAKEFID